MTARGGLNLASSFQDQPAGAKQPISEQQRNPRQQRKGRHEVESRAGELPSVDPEALDEGSDHHALGKGRDRRAVAEAVVREGAMRRVAEPKLERDAAKDQGQQHDEDREIECWDDDGERERKRRQQAKTAEHQPSLIAVPDRRDRVHDDIATADVARESVKHTHAEIEAVEQDIEKDRSTHDQGPDRHEIEDGTHGNLGSDRSSTETGAAGRPLSIGASASGLGTGPLRTSFAMMNTPAGKMTR